MEYPASHSSPLRLAAAFAVALAALLALVSRPAQSSSAWTPWAGQLSCTRGAAVVC